MWVLDLQLIIFPRFSSESSTATYEASDWRFWSSFTTEPIFTALRERWLLSAWSFIDHHRRPSITAANTTNIDPLLGFKIQWMKPKHYMSKNSHLAPLRVAFGCFLLPAFTCKKRSELQGSFTDTVVSGFGDQRVNPEGVLVQPRTSVWGSILRCSVIPSSIRFRETEPVVAHKFVCHWIFIVYLICGERFLRRGSPHHHPHPRGLQLNTL